jgi:hypothetical protein
MRQQMNPFQMFQPLMQGRFSGRARPY